MAIEACRRSGVLDVRAKGDGSPVGRADTEAHAVIAAGLARARARCAGRQRRRRDRGRRRAGRLDHVVAGRSARRHEGIPGRCARLHGEHRPHPRRRARRGRRARVRSRRHLFRRSRAGKLAEARRAHRAAHRHTHRARASAHGRGKPLAWLRPTWWPSWRRSASGHASPSAARSSSVSWPTAPRMSTRASAPRWSGTWRPATPCSAGP